MQWLDLSIEITNDYIKMLKKNMRMSFCVITINSLLATWQGYMMYTHPTSIWFGVSFGIILSSILYLFLEFISTKIELKYEILKMRKYEEMKDNELYQGAISQCDSAKVHYERAAEEFYKRIEEMSKNSPENSASATTET